ncbi:amidase [Streptomonospora sediminis]
MSAEETRWADAHEHASLVRDRAASPAELVEAAITRVENEDPVLGAIAARTFDRAREEAAADDGTKPFSGTPFLLKDLGSTPEGVEATFGSAFLKGFVPDHDAELVRRFRQAGLCSLGKTKAAELGLMPTTEAGLYGPVHNPWSPDRSPGGSSGGSAAAVAAGWVPVAHANDGGGSIRYPAGCCGVFGMKPTRARTTLGPDMGDLMSGLVAEHVVTRSVRDSAAVLDQVAGPAPGDPYHAPQSGGFADAARSGTGRRLRIAVAPPHGSGQESPQARAAVERTAALCAELGHDVVEAAPPVPDGLLPELFATLWTAGATALLRAYAPIVGRTPGPEWVEPLTWWLAEQGRNVDAADYLGAVARMHALGRQVAGFFADHDVAVSATTPDVAPPLGWFHDGDPARSWQRILDFVQLIPLANLTGQPAMSVPLYWTPAGLPLGVHALGRFGDERTLYALAGELERASPWSDRRPPARKEASV